ncbi:sulfotransferase domain-containing protein [Paracoccus aerodenitrificans]|uniref:sulfotransferase domain-containing protein n=1 Tax=Paracoccus aerodenitrificans TaxID=3017781 RepID=UPI0022F12A57|nr:sulfotransferase domain-containing protein [Paracoccus aerodenitrificans]WBU63658.1 sulfotransferase domain-containing protein [Paracoccus aerodenitrificans]
MTLPNLLIVGAQKSGTTWLHRALAKSKNFWGSDPKELNFWNQKKRNIEEYKKYFADAPPEITYVYESTPTYLRLPGKEVDIAKNIKEGLGDIPLLLMIRDPRHRYLSAYTHHMLKGRLELVEEITLISDEFLMLSLGLYAKMLSHYKNYFSKIYVHTYEELLESPSGLFERICAELSVKSDLKEKDLLFRANDKNIKKRSAGIDKLPVLSAEANQSLCDFYREDVENMSKLINRDLSHWLN